MSQTFIQLVPLYATHSGVFLNINVISAFGAYDDTRTWIDVAGFPPPEGESTYTSHEPVAAFIERLRRLTDSVIHEVGS